jgi:VIT1/CCC1 family predicted Fe2+/Mn2+ transporter
MQITMNIMPISGFRQGRFSMGVGGRRVSISVVSKPNAETPKEKRNARLDGGFLTMFRLLEECF